ncbi:LuxR C-terminal-related transcriptional regulator [Pseudodesulfovibrio sp.]|uniref:helix-turn-helix transcriptional regulator n=1 Tax=Pseudodesulfovibrio sp. TaxID=2035812 RepID=UPI00262759DB|nr:LuxR C-terminal-related transcriptional regulator [Pseudodesulfovibrio sp.]MDD3311111.1 LuxR C-terminal-related transcriptional regulator [Pseudodesulfovibrio sp.]
MRYMLNASAPVDTSTLHHGRRLMQALAVIYSRPITFVHAPMGYGKTVAVREYLGKRAARTIWTTVLTPAQSAFWGDFCRMLRRSLPEASGVADALEELGYPTDPVKLDAARGMIARVDFPPDTVLVFDDVHLLPESASGGLVALCLLLARQGGCPPIVLISRHAPGQDLAEPLLKGVVTEVEPSLFALNREEIRAYYAGCGISLDEQDAARLLKATGGWISALYLYLLHYVRHGNLAEPTEPHTLLANQIFDRLPEETRLLLLLLSPHESFPVALARLFSDRAEAILAELLRRNAFIAFDPVTSSYTLHALFREFLRKRFGDLPMEQRRDAYMRSAEWLIRRDEVSRAVKLLAEVDDCASMLDLLNTVAERMRITEGSGLRLALFRSCPPELLEQYPGVMFRYAMAALSGKDFPTFTTQLARLEGYCSSLPEDDVAANNWRGELELLRAFTRYNDIVGMSECHRRAAVYFERAGAEGSRFFGHDPWTLGSPSVLYMFYRESGTLAETLQQMRACLPHYTRLTGMHGAGAEDVMLGEALFYAGKFEAAAVAGHRALSTAREYDQVGIEICALFLLALLELVQGDFGKAMDRLRAMRERIEEKRAFSLLQTVDLCSGFLHAFLHRSEGIPPWLAQGGDEKFYAFAGGCSYIVLGYSLLHAGEYAELVGRISQQLEKGIFARNLMFSIYGHLLVAAGDTGLGLLGKADTALLAALDLALPDDILMPFAVHASFLPQLKPLKDDPTYGPGVTRILQLSAILEKARNGIVSRCFPEATRPLTPRERELVRLALAGMTYKKIGSATGLAPNSVKRYFAALYKKLGISNREQLKQYFHAEDAGGR